jgi:hypothetical protein
VETMSTASVQNLEEAVTIASEFIMSEPTPQFMGFAKLNRFNNKPLITYLAKYNFFCKSSARKRLILKVCGYNIMNSNEIFIDIVRHSK